MRLVLALVVVFAVVAVSAYDESVQEGTEVSWQLFNTVIIEAQSQSQSLSVSWDQ